MSLSFVSHGFLITAGGAGVFKIICDEIVEADLYENDRIIAEVQNRTKKRGNADFKFFKGDNHNQRFKVTLEGEVMNITGSKLIFTVKEKAKDVESIFQKKNAAAGGSNAEIEMLDPVNGLFAIYILPEDTNEIDADLFYEYDIEMILLGEITTIKRGLMLVLQDVT